METEIWKDIPDYEGLYQISNLSNAKSMERERVVRYGLIFTYKEKILKTICHNGYLAVTLYKNHTHKTVKIHRLIAQAFIPNPLNLPQVNHINGNPIDNRIENLEWVTARENNTHRFRGQKTSSKFTGVCWHKLTQKWITTIRINGKRKHLGLFTVEEEAGNAYKNALKNHGIQNTYTC